MTNSEWFWSRASAQEAAARINRRHGSDGFRASVRYAMAADGRAGWLLEVRHVA